MTTLPTKLIGEAYQSTYHWELLCDLVDIDNRMAGQDGEHEGAALLAETFEDHGVREIELAEFELTGWWRGSSALTLEYGGREHVFDGDYQTIALPGTPSSDIEAELVDVGYGRPKDFKEVNCEGKIVVSSSATPDDYERWIHRLEKYGFAINHGAAAFVFRNHVEGCLPPTGSVGNNGGVGSIPAVGVSKEVGERLVRYCEDENVEATLFVDCRNAPSTSVNVTGVLGPDTGEEVLVTAHHDAHDISEGANDNGVGSVLVAEVARLLSRVEDDLDTRVRLLILGAEEVGLFGSEHWAESHSASEVKAVLNVDGAGYSRNLAVSTNRFDELSAIFNEVADEFAVSIDISEEVNPHSDHWPFVIQGVPGVHSRSESGETGRGWGHTHADTLDKLDVRDLRELGVLLTAASIKATETDRNLPHKSPDEIREAAIEDGLKEGMSNADRWPWYSEEEG
jgi:Zn-dependent M28 family amino/carboxypeptidase